MEHRRPGCVFLVRFLVRLPGCGRGCVPCACLRSMQPCRFVLAKCAFFCPHVDPVARVTQVVHRKSKKFNYESLRGVSVEDQLEVTVGEYV
jgi:hypothetical protein